MSRIVLTGATGFVGRQIHRRLAEAGHDVVPVLRPGSARRLLEGARAEHAILTADVFAETSDWWAERLEGVDAVIHAAWYVEPGKYLDSPLNLDCVTGTLALARGVCGRRDPPFRRCRHLHGISPAVGASVDRCPARTGDALCRV